MTPPALKRTLIGNVPNQAGQIVAVPGQATFYVISHRSGDTYVFVDGKTPGVKLAGATVSVALGAGNEQGLLSMAFHPDFAKNKLFYLYYTAAGGGNMTIDEFELLTPTTAMKKQNIWNKPRTANQDPYHNGGTIYFNPKDGVASPILYFAVGNNNSGDAANPNGTTGRVLAIDTVTKAATSHSYGLRNPYRMSIDRLTGDMWIGDVANGPGGAVYFQPFGMKGKNWGYGNGGPEVGGGSITGRDSGSAAMIGGIVYRGNKIPGLCGRYFYGLWSSGAIKSLIQQNGMRIGAATHADISVGSLTSFGEDGEGEMILGVQGGQVYRVEKAN